MHKLIKNNRLFNETIVTKYNRCIDNEDITIVVTTDNNTPYYNVYRLTERYQNEHLNALDRQEPMEYIQKPLQYFSDAYMIGILMEYIIWDRFYDHGIAQISLGIDFEQIPN